MLFNSVIYIFLFLPMVTALLQATRKFGLFGVSRWLLILATMAFYAFAGPKLLPWLLLSMAFNYAAALAIKRLQAQPKAQDITLASSVAINIVFLGYFKYSNFLVGVWDGILGVEHISKSIVLPLGISFFTFQQMGYLIDVKRGKAAAGSLSAYANFVLFFPQLLAGPIVQYNEVVPQFESRTRRDAGSDILVGLTLFSIGLFKKTVVADTAALYAAPVFSAAHASTPLGMVDTWLGLFAYGAQIYFDFSGYSDMAIGSARMLGILLPINFHSPLRSGTTLEFWRRWHITLGRWVQAYIFQPLALALTRTAAEIGAGRWGSLLLAVVLPTMITMLVLGIWHGAGWNFIIFGLLQGVYMSVNEAWALFRRKARRARTGPPPAWGHPLAVFGTLVAFTVSIIPFGAADPAAALRLFQSALGLDGVLTAHADWPLGLGGAVVLLAAVYAAIYLVPNTQTIMARFEPALDWKKWVASADAGVLSWRPSLAWSMFTGLTLFLGVAAIARGVTKFVYFNF